jgi:hypothetical protein
MPNPTYPQTLSVPGAFPAFQLGINETSCIVSVSGPYAGVTTRFESSFDNGVTDPWSSSPALRESTLIQDSSDAGAAITLQDGMPYRWRVDCVNPGSWIRQTVVAIGSGTINQTSVKGGRFFLDAPPTLVLAAGALASAAQTNAVLALLRMLIGYAARGSAFEQPNFNLADQTLNQLVPGLVVTLPAP